MQGRANGNLEELASLEDLYAKAQARRHAVEDEIHQAHAEMLGMSFMSAELTVSMSDCNSIIICSLANLM